MFLRILETLGVPPFVGFHHWLPLNSMAMMIATMFHHSCLNFLVHVSATAAPILAATINIFVDLPLYSSSETIITGAIFYGSE